ncbi:MAG: lysozyme inhibitor LprI family protein, partial [Blastocatellia bacterium]
RGQSPKTELLKYIPISLIACAEGYLRIQCRELIDFGPPFSENAASIQQVKFDFRQVQAIRGRVVSLGDFISHLLPMNNLNDINSNLSLLIGEDFLAKLKAVEFADWPPERAEDVNRLFGEMCEGVKTTFRLRHIYCHEVAAFEVADVATIRNCFDRMSSFLFWTYWFFYHLLNPLDPGPGSSTLGMTNQAHHNCDLAEDEMTAILEKILGTLEEDRKAEFIRTDEAWRNFRASLAEFVANFAAGGSIRSLLRCMEIEATTKERIQQLTRIYEALEWDGYRMKGR